MTVLCGTNSAGKSTLLKVPLLLRQSQAAASPTLESPGRLRFVGPQANLGSYGSLVTDHQVDTELGVGLRTPLRIDTDTLDWLEAVTGDRARTHRRQARSVAQEPSEFEAFFEFMSVSPEPEHADGPLLDHQLRRAEFTIIARDREVFHWTIEATNRESESPTYRMVVPGDFFRTELAGFGNALSLTSMSDSDAREAARVPVDVPLSGLLPSAIYATVEAPGFEGERKRLPLPLDISRPLDSLRSALAGVHYLGPLRTPAERFYVAQEDSAPVFDPSGDFVPYVLRDRSDEDVPVIRPGGTEPELMSLTAGIGDWLHYLRTGERAAGVESELVVRTTRGVLVELALRPPSGHESHALADSGFGYSQVLPILVRGLLARPGETLIIEQPELHLHPGLQVRLATFLVSLAESGRQVIVETHSEHIVNSIRVIAAEDSSSRLAAMSRIVYVDGTTRPPQIHQLAVQPDGTVPDWPADFFGEALDLSGRLLRAQRRRREGQS